MTKPATKRKHLRLYSEQPPKSDRSSLESVACLPDLMRAFQGATGWRLQYGNASSRDDSKSSWSAAIGMSDSTLQGCLTLDRAEGKSGSKAGKRGAAGTKGSCAVAASAEFRPPRATSVDAAFSPIDHDAARLMARSIADLLGELIDTRRSLWQREAELAAGVPLVPHREGEKHLAERLQAALKAAAEVVDADAVALYMLDEATTELKLRSAWGLPFDRLTAPARPLQGALADLEALLGHAVVLDDPQTIQMWNAPEDFPAAVCVPVSTPTTLLGTLWVFAQRRRSFSDQQTNMIEVVAGRVAADLEREMLVRVGTDGAELQKQLAAAGRLQRNELPGVAPMIDGWQIAGSTSQMGEVGGAFHDWFSLPRGLLAVAVGRAAQSSMAGALTAKGVRTAVRSHARYHREAQQIVQQANLTLWTGSAGDQQASLWCGLIETATGRVCCSSAGTTSVLRLGPDGWQSLSRPASLLGEGAETEFEQFGHELQAGETLVMFALGPVRDDAGRRRTEAEVAELLQNRHDCSAAALTTIVGEALRGHLLVRQPQDISVLVVRRTA